MDEAQALADRVAVMVDGRIVALGTPAEIGGRDTAPTEIAFALPAGVGLGDLPDARRRRRRRDGAGRVRVIAPARGCGPPTRSPAGRSSAASSCAASPSASPRWRTSTYD